MPVRVKVIAIGNHMLSPMSYLRAFDHEANDGRGKATLTHDPSKAMLFTDMGAVFEFWNKVPQNRPLRPDGKPNKPLSVASMEIEYVDGTTLH